MSKITISDKQWCGISIVDVLIYTLIASIFNFAYFYFQSEFVVDNIKWNVFVISTLIWVFGCTATRLSYLYANNRIQKTTRE
jgi:hypothetical protein